MKFFFLTADMQMDNSELKKRELVIRERRLM
jgi:hypothetical protein